MPRLRRTKELRASLFFNRPRRRHNGGLGLRIGVSLRCSCDKERARVSWMLQDVTLRQRNCLWTSDFFFLQSLGESRYLDTWICLLLWSSGRKNVTAGNLESESPVVPYLRSRHGEAASSDIKADHLRGYRRGISCKTSERRSCLILVSMITWRNNDWELGSRELMFHQILL